MDLFIRRQDKVDKQTDSLIWLSFPDAEGPAEFANLPLPWIQVLQIVPFAGNNARSRLQEKGVFRVVNGLR